MALRLLAILLHFLPDPLQQPDVVVDIMLLLRSLAEDEDEDDDDDDVEEEEEALTKETEKEGVPTSQEGTIIPTRQTAKSTIRGRLGMRTTPQEEGSSSLFTTVRTTTEKKKKEREGGGGVRQWMEKELLFDPLLAIVSDERALGMPELLYTALCILQECAAHAGVTRETTADADRQQKRTPPSSTGEQAAPTPFHAPLSERNARLRSTTTTPSNSHPLITLGVIPTITAIARAILVKAEIEEEKKEQEKDTPHTSTTTTMTTSRTDDLDPTDSSPPPLSASPASSTSSFLSTSASEWAEVILVQICLLYRHFAMSFASHLCQFHALDLLLLMLYFFSSSHQVVEAASRALAKLVFDPTCLAHLASNPNFMRAALRAMTAQVLHSPSAKRMPVEKATGISHMRTPSAHETEKDPLRHPAESSTSSPLLSSSVPPTPLTTTTTASSSLSPLPDLADDDAHCHLLVARLAGTMARVAEQSEDQRDMLARHGEALLVALLQRFVRLDHHASLLLHLPLAPQTSRRVNLSPLLPSPSAEENESVAHQKKDDPIEPNERLSASTVSISCASGGAANHPRLASPPAVPPPSPSSSSACLFHPDMTTTLAEDGVEEVDAHRRRSSSGFERHGKNNEGEDEDTSAARVDPLEWTVQSIADATLTACRSPTKRQAAAAALRRPWTGTTDGPPPPPPPPLSPRHTTCVRGPHVAHDGLSTPILPLPSQERNDPRLPSEKHTAYPTIRQTPTPAKGVEDLACVSSSSAYTENLPLIQAVVWLVGVAGMSTFCSVEVVLQGVEQLTALVQDIFEMTALPVRSSSSSGSGDGRPFFLDAGQKAHLVAATRPTFLYALMAISNLSFFFGSILQPHDDEPVEKKTATSPPPQQKEEAKTKTETETQMAPKTIPRIGASDATTMELKTNASNHAARLMALYESLALTAAGLLFSGDTEAAVEATRMISNICFTPAGADWVEAHRLDEVLVLFMGHEDRRIVYNSAGALVNLTAATTCRVVVDPDLLALLLQYTRHWTKGAEEAAPASSSDQEVNCTNEDEAKGSNASPHRRRTEKGSQTPRGEKEKKKKRKKKSFTTEMDKKATSVTNDRLHSSSAWREKSYWEQINGVVQRLLHNISGLLLVKDANKES